MYIILSCTRISDAVFDLRKHFFEISEDASSLDICVELKNTIKRNISVYLNVENGSATGNTFTKTYPSD